MTLFKVQHNKNYTVVNNTISRDKRVSWSARGIWLYAFSRQEDWEFYLKDLINQTDAQTSAVTTAIKNLEDCGYLRREIIRDKKGRVEKSEWTFYETPLHYEPIKPKEPKEKKPSKSTFQPICDYPILDNQRLISNEVTYSQESPKSSSKKSKIKETISDSAQARKGEIAENRKSSLLDLDIESSLEFCEQMSIGIKRKDLEIWSTKYTSDEIFAALRLILDDEGCVVDGLVLKKPIKNHAAFVNKALGEKWSKDRENMEVNKQFAEEVKSKGWKALVITKQYCRCSSTGNDWSFKLNPDVFRREIETYIEKQRQAYEARKLKSYD